MLEQYDGTITGWEMVELRGQTWNAVTRQYGPTAYMVLSTLMASIRGRTLALRPVTPQDPPLAGSHVPDPKADDEEFPMADRNTSAKTEGYTFALALAEVFQVKTGKMQPVFALGRRFAAFAGYADADGAFAYIEGFVSGIQGTATKEIEAGDES